MNLWQVQTTQMIKRFLQILLFKLNPYNIVKSKQQEVSTATWLQIKQIP